MNTNRDFDRIAGAWLAEGPSELADRVLDAALDEVHLTHQRRPMRVPWRTPPMSTPLRFAAVIAIVAVAGVAAMTFLNRSPGPGTTPVPSPTLLESPTPTPEPTIAGLDTSGWIAYTSERYGFDIKRPPNFIETASDHVWQLADANEFPPSAGELFYYPGLVDGQGVGVSAWSVAVETGTTLEAWLISYCEAQTGSDCTTYDRGSSLTMDGHPGFSFAGPSEDSRAFVLVGDRVYAVSAWRTENDPSVAEFGGGRRLVEAFMATMTLRSAGPAPVASAPALSGSFTSTRYGYSIDFPETFWTATAATELWEPGVDMDGWEDTIRPASEVNGFRAASAVIPGGVTVDDWIAENVTYTPLTECGPDRLTLSDIVVDGLAGKVRYSCEETEATVIVGDRVYLFTLFLDAGEPYSTAGGRALFDAMMATVQLTPETAEAAPSPTP